MDEKSNILLENFWDYYLPYSAFNSEWLGPLLGAVSRGELETPNVASCFPFLHVVEPIYNREDPLKSANFTRLKTFGFSS